MSYPRRHFLAAASNQGLGNKLTAAMHAIPEPVQTRVSAAASGCVAAVRRGVSAAVLGAVAVLLGVVPGWAQAPAQVEVRGPAQGSAGFTAPVLTIPRVDPPPRIEDFLEMRPSSAVEGRMAKADAFLTLEPKDGATPVNRTEVYLGYDQQNLYAVWVAFAREPGALRAPMSRRDSVEFEHDVVVLYLDTFNDRLRAYNFLANPQGVQTDAIWTDPDDRDPSFDTVWHAEGKRNGKGYVVLMTIPFKSLRFPPGSQQTWGLLLQRWSPHDGENSFWPALSTQVQGRLSRPARMEGLDGISSGRSSQVMPYGVFRAFRELDTRDPALPVFDSRRAQVDGGVDAKFVLKDSLVLDVTLNPDFSQVESDQPQTTVNQRFEVFFPEKRPFFLENAGFFRTPINLLFTRRIADPQFGVRLTGKIGRTAVGALLVDDQSPGRVVAENDANAGARAYFGVLRVSHEFRAQSSLGFIATDRELRPNSGSTCGALRCQAVSNRVGGVDGNIRINNNWRTRFQAVTSTTDTLDGTHLAGQSYFARLEHEGRHWVYNGEYHDTGSGFRTLPGFFRRTDFRRESHFGQYRFRTENKILQWWGLGFFQLASWDHAGERLDRNFQPEVVFQFQRETVFVAWHGFQRERLRPVDFSQLTANRDFDTSYNGFFFASNYFRLVNVRANLDMARGINFSPPSGLAPFPTDSTFANLRATIRPFDKLTMENSYLLTRLRERASGRSIFNNHILRSKFGYQHNKRLSFRTIFQYDATLANPALTSLQTTKNFNADFLATYLVQPGTAIYVGYNSNLQNLDRSLGFDADGNLLRTRNRFLNDGRQIFVKVSYLFRF